MDREAKPRLGAEVEAIEDDLDDRPEPPDVLRVPDVLLRRGGVEVEASLELTSQGLVIGTRESSRRVTREEIRGAWIEGEFEQEELRFELADGYQFGLAFDLEDMRRALDLLGLAPTERALRMTLGSVPGALERTGSVLAGLVGVGSLVMVLEGGLLGFAAAALASVGAVALVARAHKRAVVTVGADGIAIQEGKRTRFFRFADVEELNLDRTGIEIVVGKEVVRIPGRLTIAERSALEERLRFTRFASTPASGALEVTEAFERRGRSIADWRTAMARALDAPPSSYRSRPLRVEDARALAQDRDARIEIRLGAALALASRGAAGRQEVALLAGATADDALREAFAAIARETLDDQMLEALLK